MGKRDQSSINAQRAHTSKRAIFEESRPASAWKRVKYHLLCSLCICCVKWAKK